MNTLRKSIALPVAAGALFCSSYLSGAETKAALNLDKQPLSAQRKAETGYSDIVKRTSPSVVNIFSTQIVKSRFSQEELFNNPMFRKFFGDRFEHPKIPQGKQRREGLGSGVIVSSDGYILTNNHVIAEADEIKVGLPDEKKEYIAKVIGTDPGTDIAVLKIEATGLTAITMTDSDHVEVGDMALAIGNPFGVGKTVTKGIVSALGRGVGLAHYENFIQTDAAVNPGNSGGALVDADGRLIGINTAIFSRSGGSQGIGFAVPINLARSVMERLLTHGKVVRGFLGVQLQKLSPELAETMGLDDAKGALVAQVIEDGAAEAAGFKAGDVIIEFGGKAIDSGRKLQLIVARTAPKTEVKVIILRNGKKKKLTVVLKERDDDQLASSTMGGKGELIDGVEVANLTPERRQQFGLPKKVQGVLVTSVAQDGVAGKSNLVAGDVITLFDGQKVEDTKGLLKLRKATSKTRVLLRVLRQEMMMFVPVQLK
ncbi:hypothetical protein BVY04_05495 [bacterium M21]|nr:hypothetical protein BVY04_05495 [bacterium M21]